MQIKALTQATRAEVCALAQTAANRDEALDTANVFPIGTDHHAVFTTEYLAQFGALEGVDGGVQILFPVGCLSHDQGLAAGKAAHLASGGSHDS